MRASASHYSAVMPWAIQEHGQATFSNSVNPQGAYRLDANVKIGQD